jgi:DNA-binding beta-propeller fold protein YncE
MMKWSSPGLPAAIRGWVFACSFLASGFLGCAPPESGGGTGGTGATGGAGGSGPAPRLVVTADWLNQSLTLLDYAKLTDGESDAEASIVGTIDLSAWEPGPLEVELTPDGTTAVVSVGPGFFDGFSIIGSPDVPEGGTLLVVDLESGEADSIDTAHVPMGIAISPDGMLAYTANYGTTDAPGHSLSVIDIASRTVVEEIGDMDMDLIGLRPEQVRLSPDGTLGAINVTGEDGVRVFQTSNIAGTMTDVVATGDDPSDLTFLGGNDRLVVANSRDPDVTLIDTSNPSAPLAIQSFIVQGGVRYGLTFVPSRGSILAPLSPVVVGVPASLSTILVDGDILRPSLPQELPGSSFPLTAAVDSTGDFAFVAHVSDNQLSIIDLETGATRAIGWLTEPGPTYVAVQR